MGRTLLYICERENRGYTIGLGQSGKPLRPRINYAIKHRVNLPINLREIKGVVLVGSQAKVFREDSEYLRFLEYVHSRDWKVAAAVIEPLPNNNNGIDNLLGAPDLFTQNELARRIHEFFCEMLNLSEQVGVDYDFPRVRSTVRHRDRGYGPRGDSF